MFNSYVMNFVLYVHLSLIADLQLSQSVRFVPKADVANTAPFSDGVSILVTGKTNAECLYRTV